MCLTSAGPSRYWNEEFRAITTSDWNRDNSVMMSSVIPSLKYRCSGSPLKFANGRTAIDGFDAVIGLGSSEGALTASFCSSKLVGSNPLRSAKYLYSLPRTTLLGRLLRR